MPANWIYTDTQMPRFVGSESESEKIEEIQNYLFMLVEQLRYTLRNLDMANMNGTAVEKFTGEIEGRFSVMAGKKLQSYATLQVMENEITAAVTDADGSYGLLKLTSNGLFVGGEKKTITSDLLDESVNQSISDAANAAERAASAASSAGSAAYSALYNIRDLANGDYTGGTFISGRGLVTPKLYAASGDMTQFAEMLPDGFATYHQPSGGTAYRKILLGYSNKSRTDDSGTLCPALYLGSTMPLKLEKYFDSGNKAWIGNEDEDCGILFNMNTKEMTFVGTVNATITGGTTHVFA